MDLTIKLNELPPEGTVVELDVSVQEINERMARRDAPIQAAAPLTGRIEVLPAGGEKYIARGRIQTAIRTGCDRCLEPFDWPVAEDVVVMFVPGEPEAAEEELEPETLNEEYYQGEEIDIWPILAEHLILSLPLKTLCREDCPGLCPVCGQNLDQGACRCEPETGHPGLAGLAELRDQLPSQSEEDQ
jgi:uncharacterized protein